MSAPLSFDDFLRAHGARVWEATRKRREGQHHGGNRCPGGRPSLIGGRLGDDCPDCVASWTDTLLELWSGPKDPRSDAAVASAYVDTQRKTRVHFGMAAKPDRDLDTAAWAAPLREHAWVPALLKEMVWFAASTDVCAEDWPYDRFADRVPDLPIPVRQAVPCALDMLRSAKPGWAERNIDIPMGRRMAVTVAPLDFIDADECVLVGQDLEYSSVRGL